MHNPNTHGEDEKLGFKHENLEGYIPSLATPAEIHDAFDKAFDFRGDLTITLKTGDSVEGYVFDRRAESADLSECTVRLYPKNSAEKMSIRYSDIAALSFTGKDSAAGKSFEAWVKKYNEKKAAGEKNIGIDAEPLD
ncbi:hypothetical protein Acid345_1014 [Candidatus Koribacter versatilis Ellin345]|uniref:Uncharacterized protein n=1 Tax=Koribacter versatilis (strain Ellin345) TaxID=204669 RepID=Q1ISY3_KORVE|nr:hypothetical protein [Candidatus Koribacter versatilis]ABF40017.1 hypothetical protein Acid345_1014 [Candidatus Koribacter versatilis Ellin345]